MAGAGEAEAVDTAAVAASTLASPSPSLCPCQRHARFQSSGSAADDDGAVATVAAVDHPDLPAVLRCTNSAAQEASEEEASKEVASEEEALEAEASEA